MNTYIGKLVTFTHDEIGTIAVNKIQRALELGEKRKRKSALNELRALLPTPDNAPSNYTYTLLGVSLGVDVNGELLVFASYRMTQQETANASDTK